MTTPQAVFAGLALIAIAIFAGQIAKPADAGLMNGAGYSALGGTPAFINELWRINGDTGQVSYCWLDEKAQPPYCGPWSKLEQR